MTIDQQGTQPGDTPLCIGVLARISMISVTGLIGYYGLAPAHRPVTTGTWMPQRRPDDRDAAERGWFSGVIW